MAKLGFGGTLCAALVWLCVGCGDSDSSGGAGTNDGGGADGSSGDGDGDGDRDGGNLNGFRDGGGPGDGGGGVGGASDGGGAFQPCEGPDCPTEADCTSSQAWNGFACAPCPACNGEGEDGRWPETTADGFCICKTKPGFYYSTGAEVAAFPCDADGDGWVREGARTSIEAKDDPQLQMNARCDLRRINQVILRTEGGQDQTVAVAPTLSLYETDRNDDDALLKRRWAKAGLPNYRTDGLPVRASEVNSLTKLCHDAVTDYNDNGVADVKEWEQHALPPNVRVDDQSMLMRFGYFTELHVGFYQGTSGSGPGSYVIAEKKRSISEVDTKRVQLDYGPSEGTHWRECTVHPDTAYGTLNPPVGLDFASAKTSSGGWPGMNHHSQFKCLTVVTTANAGNPNAVTKATLASNAYRINRCRAHGDPVAQAGAPALTKFTCEVLDPAATQAGSAYWGLDRYDDYQDADEYVRGCINSCVVPNTGCDDVIGPTKGELLPGCLRDPLNFGKKIGCAEECDGIDNDNDVAVDESTTGLPCDTQPQNGLTPTQWAETACLAGATQCSTGAFSCFPNVIPGQLAEACDGVDNDCDGTVDEPGGIAQVGQNCNPAIADDGTVLTSLCAEGKWECGAHPMTGDIELLCKTSAIISADLPCDNTDNDCDGVTDETKTYFEGDPDPLKNLERPSQCDDGIDNNCDTKIDNLGGPVEICGNDIDDDCDGNFDESYIAGASRVDSMNCVWPCAVEGQQRCSHQGLPSNSIWEQPTALLTAPAGADAAYIDVNPKAAWGMYAPFYNNFWKVLQCQSGIWQIYDVCGLTSIPTYTPANGDQTPPTWTNTNSYCSENTTSKTAACQASSAGVVISDKGNLPLPTNCQYPTTPSCLSCWSGSAPSHQASCVRP